MGYITAYPDVKRRTVTYTYNVGGYTCSFIYSGNMAFRCNNPGNIQLKHDAKGMRLAAQLGAIGWIPSPDNPGFYELIFPSYQLGYQRELRQWAIFTKRGFTLQEGIYKWDWRT